MSVTSFSFMLFVAISLAVYYVVPKKWQWLVLLADNIIFYFFNATAYTVIYLLASIITTYLAARYFEKTDEQIKKKRVLIITIIFNIGILALLKYTNLAINTVDFFLVNAGKEAIPTVEWMAALGISFYTLQLISYLLDCYWGVIKPQNSILKYAVFASYFPQMISGPISRYSQIGEQFFKGYEFDWLRIKNGVIRAGWGMTKKLVIATRLGQYVDVVYSNLDTYQGIYLGFAILIYPMQLYTDFSGCMDIIIGVSECFGVILPDNFRTPFFSKTVQEFWQRFHITLGTWLKDYIMFPVLKSSAWNKLGKNLKKKFGKKLGKQIPTWLGMLVLWMCMGIWHGNSWKYVVGEGFWFWFVIVLGQIFEPLSQKVIQKMQINVESFGYRLFQMLRTYGIYCIGILFFRADSIKHALKIIYGAVSEWNLKVLLDGSLTDFVWGTYDLVLLAISLLTLFVVDRMLYSGINVREKLQEQNIVFRWFVYLTVTLVVLFSMGMSVQEFIYARF